MTTKNFTIRMVDTVGQYQRIKNEIDAGIQDVLETGIYIGGPHVQKFGENLAHYLGVSHAIPCGNGTDALQIALMALGLKPGDEVITSSFTFIATAEVIALLGLTPVFVDSDADTFNISPRAIEKAITPKTKCIIPVHLFGQPAPMEEILAIAKRHNLFVIEDNAQSIGSDYTFSDGTVKKTGTMGDIGCTSFYPSKNLGAYGDAGAIFTNDQALGEKIRTICNHGSKVRYYHSEVGVNSRLDAIQAVVLDTKLGRLNEYNVARENAAYMYDARLGAVDGIQIPVRMQKGTHVFHQYTIRILGGRAVRDELRKQLDAKGIPSMVYYPVPLHQQEAYLRYSKSMGPLPVAEQLSKEVLSLPMHSELDESQVDFICTTLIQTFNAINKSL